MKTTLSRRKLKMTANDLEFLFIYELVQKFLYDFIKVSNHCSYVIRILISSIIPIVLLSFRPISTFPLVSIISSISIPSVPSIPSVSSVSSVSVIVPISPVPPSAPSPPVAAPEAALPPGNRGILVLGHGVKEIILLVFLRICKYLVGHHNLLNVDTLERHLCNQFVMGDHTLVISVAQILDLLQNEGFVLVIDLWQKSFELLASFESDGDFVFEEVFHFLCWHLAIL